MILYFHREDNSFFSFLLSPPFLAESGANLFLSFFAGLTGKGDFACGMGGYIICMYTEVSIRHSAVQVTGSAKKEMIIFVSSLVCFI